jgi:hypothetical protein
MTSSATFTNPTDDQIKSLLSDLKRVAVVGISAKEDRASHGIARWLVGLGLEVVGVNPVLKEPVLGLEIYPELSDVPGKVDLVDVFRRGDTVDPIIDQAIARSDGGIWLQEQVVNAAAAQRAHDAGLFSLMDRCIYKEWLRLMNG